MSKFRIVQLLDVYDGVVVQGPPGTGKTHTIANVISHYLANGVAARDSRQLLLIDFGHSRSDCQS